MKTITFLTTFTIAVSLLISGCTINPAPDLDKLANVFEGVGGDGGGYTWSGPPYTYVYGPTLWMDSIAHLSDSTATLWGHYQYDSVLIIQKGQLNYGEDINPMPPDAVTISKPYQTQPDTIDFRTLPDSISSPRKEWIYRFSVSMDSLKSKTSYHFCISGDYQDKNEMKQLTTCNYFMSR